MWLGRQASKFQPGRRPLPRLHQHQFRRVHLLQLKRAQRASRAQSQLQQTPRSTPTPIRMPSSKLRMPKTFLTLMQLHQSKAHQWTGPLWPRRLLGPGPWALLKPLWRSTSEMPEKVFESSKTISHSIVNCHCLCYSSFLVFSFLNFQAKINSCRAQKAAFLICPKSPLVLRKTSKSTKPVGRPNLHVVIGFKSKIKGSLLNTGQLKTNS